MEEESKKLDDLIWMANNLTAEEIATLRRMAEAIKKHKRPEPKD